MERLNYKHLYYFWVVAQESSLTGAAERLHLTPQTLCGQIRSLEERLEVKLLRREGRNMVLTDTGRMVFHYADSIFCLGEEMVDAVRRQLSVQSNHFRVGLTDFLPKLVAYRLLQPVLYLPEHYRLHCYEDRMENLVAGLAAGRLDLILSDRPLANDSPVKAYNHFLGECGVSFLGKARLAERYRDGFPSSLDGAPVLMVGADSVMRGRLWGWFERQGIRPHAVAEFDDSALMKVFGQAGIGIFPVPTLIENEVCQQYQVELIGRTDDIRECFYAISLERRLHHPAVSAIHQSARQSLRTDGL